MDGVPLMVLIRAAEALKAAKQSPVGKGLNHEEWEAVMRSYNELNLHIERVAGDAVIEIEHTHG